MISPNHPVIMDATSTTSSYDTIERNDAKRMYSSVSDSRDEITERELLEDLNQDPEDEDTLSDDSLRLRVSDDEVDTSQTGEKFELATACCSSEQTTSQDTATGSIDSDKKIALSSETEQSIHESCKSESDQDYQSSTESNQTLDEICIGSEKNMNSMCKAQRQRQHFFTASHSPKRSYYHSRYDFGNLSTQKSLSYFNNHDNFGKLPGNRKHGRHWKHSKGKPLHSSRRNAQDNSVQKGTPNPIPVQRSKSHVDTEGDCVQSYHILSDNVSKENHEALSSADNKVPKECGTSSPNQELKHSPKTLAEFCADNCNRNDSKSVSSSSCDSILISDNATDAKSIASNEQCNDTISSSDNPKPPESRTIMSTPAFDDRESTASLSKENETAIDNVPLPQNNSIESSDIGMTTTEVDIGVNSSVFEPMSNDTDVNVECVTQKQVDINNRVAELKEKSNQVIDSLDTAKDLGSGVKPCYSEDVEEQLEGKPESDYQHSAVDENQIIKSLLNNISDDEMPDNKNNVKNEENIEEKQTKTSLVECEKVTQEALKIIINHKDIDNNRDGITSDNRRKLSRDTEETELTECTPQKEISENAEEIVSNNVVCSETSIKSKDNNEENVTKKSSSKLESNIESRQHVMKRSLQDADSVTDKLIHKKMKIDTDSVDEVCSEQPHSLLSTHLKTVQKQTMSADKSNESPEPLRYVRKFFQRDMKGKLTKLKREDLEELIIQKLVETITMRSEIGRLREQARISERNQEATRIRCQQLSKQIKDFDMVLSRNAIDRRANNDRPVAPIKINRSVGLQVNFITEPGIQSLKALSSNNTVKTNVPALKTVNGRNTTGSDNAGKTTAPPRRGIKVRSPRRAEVPKSASLPVPPLTSTAAPTTYVVSKPADTSHNLPMLINSKQPILPNVNPIQPVTAKVQNIVINGKTSNQPNRHINMTNNHIAETNDLIDLTEEEDKNKSISRTTTSMLPMVGTVTPSIATKISHNRYQRMVQGTIPGNVAMTPQSANIRVVQSVGQPTPTALVNNINAGKLTYVMQGTSGTRGQLLITSNPNQIRPATSTTRGQFSNLSYKTGTSPLANGTVRVLTTTASPISNTQPIPAPLPKTPHYQPKNGWKQPPPPPSVKISKVGQDIVLSWNMTQSEDYADIASYQLYAYQEIPGAPPNPNLWKKVGDVRALPLPMACTLKEFTPGNNYHFAVRAVDVHSRLGHYSIPRNISL